MTDFKKHLTFENIYFTFSMVVLLVWLYLCGNVLLLGAAVERAARREDF